MAEKKLSGAGLRGQVAGETALCTVGKTGTGLTYRGYDISELAEKAQFEEVAFLLLKGHLPTQLCRKTEITPHSSRCSKGGARTHSRRRTSHGCYAHWLLHAG